MQTPLPPALPLYLTAAPAGEVTVERCGAYWRFTARCARREGLLRLSLYDAAGRSVYLGLMEPRGEGMVLQRSLSRAALGGLVPAYAAEAPLATVPLPPAAEGEKEWLRRADGTLVQHEGGCFLLALPCALRRKVPGTDVRCIGGETYLVFRY